MSIRSCRNSDFVLDFAIESLHGTYHVHLLLSSSEGFNYHCISRMKFFSMSNVCSFIPTMFAMFPL